MYKVPDAIRYVTLFYASVTIFLSFAIMRTFLNRNPPKLIRKHVVRISLTYVGMVLLVSIDIMTRLGTPLTFRAPTLFGLMTFAMLAQLPLYQFEKHVSVKEETRKPEEPTPRRRVTDGP